MKFSEMLGEPEPEREQPDEPDPISVFAPVPVSSPSPPTTVEYPTTPPEPVTPASHSQPGPAMPAPPVPAPPAPAVPEAEPRNGLAEVNVRQSVAAPADEADTAADPMVGLAGLDVVVDDLLPSARRARR
jgi:hypothetical protein